MFLSGLVRPSVWLAMYRASGVSGNMKGEGRLLGGLFVIGPGDEGILLEHREMEWGDHATSVDIMKAVESIKASPGAQDD
ncbi:hypothetical protein NP493_454g03034 [Ridgeia piscesae]|uniref:Peroxiredoxin-like 2A n=1 Tax=Ridgeia piscesae TaxID=27915 RepID=A0AAD9NTJ9_RIDPI|nr:hypothetical protein NP493_454g03034 [Ridgeia piscesae]